MIKKFNSQNNTLSLTFKNIYYPIFQYERIRLPNAGNGKLPYGECFTNYLNEDATMLTCGYWNDHVNIFNLTEKKAPLKFKVSNYPIESIKWNEKKSNNNCRLSWWKCISLAC